MFNKLVGNEQVKHTLSTCWSNGRVPNSMLFAGDDGIGKRQFALELARAFVCIDPTNGEACDICTACQSRRYVCHSRIKRQEQRRIQKVFFGEHLDVGTVISYKSNILVDAIRHLESHAHFQPYEAKARFFIIDDADKMNDAASNALLKTLEEPAPTSHIFLITSRPDSLLADHPFPLPDAAVCSGRDR